MNRADRLKHRAVAKFKREEDLAKVAMLRRDGKSIREMARELNVSQRWVSRRIEWLFEEWRAIISQGQHAIVADLLDKHTYVWAEAMAAWTSSKGKSVTHRTRTREGKERYKEASIETKDSDGDPRYLDVAQRSLEAIRKLLVPESINVNHTAKDEGGWTFFDLLQAAKSDPLPVVQVDGTVLRVPLEEQEPPDRPKIEGPPPFATMGFKSEEPGLQGPSPPGEGPES